MVKKIAERELFLPDLVKAATRLRNIQTIHLLVYPDLPLPLQKLMDVELEEAMNFWEEHLLCLLQWCKNQELSVSEVSARIYEAACILGESNGKKLLDNATQ